jgi:catechol 2,3-dioxygenase-like lactoylglutathione lyase family enzyme
MINGTHVVIYSRDAEADRAFFRDVLKYPHIDAGDGWLIFKVPPGEVAIHPIEDREAHELFLMCDDITATVAELTAKGIQFARPVSDEGWGLMSSIKLPGGGEVGLYEPRHPTAHSL